MSSIPDSHIPNSNTLLLIDGSGFIFRAYHKLPPLTRADGTPTGAVYGFTTMLLKLREETQATHAAVVFDAKGKNFRHDLYEAYKANRPPAPEDLIPQFPLVRDAARAMSLPVIEQEGVEADDIIATYAKQGAQQGMQVSIVSSDKDLMQLLGDGVTMFDPMKNKPLTLEDVEAKFGVTPDQVVEVQALMGDSTDNIPGVPGIGPKTAAELIQRFGTLENLLDHTHEITQKKRREMLETHRELALISKQLVTLKADCDGLPDVDSFGMPDFDVARLLEFCEEQNFTTIGKRLRKHYGVETAETDSSASAALSDKRDYHTITTIEQLQEVIRQIEQVGHVAFDVETTSLDATQAELVGLSLCSEIGTACYLPLQHKQADSAGGDLFAQQTTLAGGQVPLQEALSALKSMLESPAILKIGQNIKYDALVMRSYGIDITAMDDTMLLSYCLGAGAHNHNMDELAKRHLDITPIPFKEVVGTGKAQITFDYVPIECATDYAAEDADITLRLWTLLKPQLLLSHLSAVYERLERPLVPVITAMEAHGVKVDRTRLTHLSNRFATDMHTLEQEIYRLAGQHFNIGSPKQLGEILFDSLALAKGKKSSKSGAYVTDAETLEELTAQGHALPEKVLAWRQLSKLKSTYTDALMQQIHPKTERIHTSYSLAATSTGRLSSSDPNLQNIPIRTEQGRMIREAFIAEGGFTLMAADYSQIELRLLAHIAGINALKDAFRENKDIHAITASQVFGVSPKAVDGELRRKAKTINFGIIYGISAHGLATRLAIPRTQAAEYIEAYFTQYPGIRRYMERVKEEAREQGYVTTLWGRRCHTPLIHDKNPNRRAFAERAAINAPLQGSAADIIKRAMIAVDRLLRQEQATSRMLLQVHDELVFEIADGEDALIPRIQRTMEQAAALDVPLVVETGTGQHWGEAH